MHTRSSVMRLVRFVVRLLHLQIGKLRPKHRAFYETFPLPWKLERELWRIDFEDPVDPGGYCPLPKKQALMSLIVENGLQRAVEIGVYRGSSLIPQAAALRLTGGTVTGIDPYSRGWRQKQGVANMKAALGDDYRTVLDAIDWEELYREIRRRIERFELEEQAVLVRGFSYNVSAQIEGGIELLHIDGDHDFDAVHGDIESYLPKVTSGGFVVFDDLDWEGVRPHYDALKERLTVVHEATSWGVLRNR